MDHVLDRVPIQQRAQTRRIIQLRHAAKVALGITPRLQLLAARAAQVGEDLPHQFCHLRTGIAVFSHWRPFASPTRQVRRANVGCTGVETQGPSECDRSSASERSVSRAIVWQVSPSARNHRGWRRGLSGRLAAASASAFSPAPMPQASRDPFWSSWRDLMASRYCILVIYAHRKLARDRNCEGNGARSYAMLFGRAY